MSTNSNQYIKKNGINTLKSKNLLNLLRQLLHNLPGKLAGLLGRLQKLPGRVVKIVKNLPYINLRKLGSLRIPNHLKNLRYLKSLRSRKALLFFAGILIILVPLAFIFLKSPPQVEAGWWDDNWSFRKRVTVSNSGSEQTNYQMGITLDTATLITNGKIQSDCADIRVADVQGKILPHWIQTCNDSSSIVWTKLGTVPTHNITLYVYYGNSGAANAENGDEVFTFFDDFSDGVIDTGKWSVTDNNGSVTETGGVLEIVGQNAWNTNGIGSIPTFDRSSQAYMMYWRMKANNIAADGVFGYTPSSLTIDNGIQHYFQGNSNWLRRRDNVTSGVLDSFAANTYYDAEILMKSSTGYTIYKDGASLEDDTTFADNNHSVAMQEHDTYIFTYDAVYVRKYATTAPSASLGSEEVGPGPTAYWKFDEGHSVTAHDSTQNQNNAITSTLVAVEQQINIMDQAFTTTAKCPTYDPAIDDFDSLGLVHWDADKYSGASVYLEAVGWRSSYVARTGLYKEDGTQVATVDANVGGWWRVRTEALSLDDDTNYGVRFCNTQGNSTSIAAVRLIVVQNDPYKINNTSTHVEVGNTEKQGSSTATQLTDKKIYYYDSSKFTPAPATSFSAMLRSAPPTIEQQINIIDQAYTTTANCGSTYDPTDNSLGLIHWDADKYSGTVSVYFEAVGTRSSWVARAGLFKEDGTKVADVDGNVNGWFRVRSDALTLDDDTNYGVRFCNNQGQSTTFAAARLVVVQTDSTKITDTETQVEVGDKEKFSNSSYSALTDPKYHYYDASKFSGTETHHFEASLEGGIKQGQGRIWSSGFELNGTGDQELYSFAGTYSIQGTTYRSGSYALQNNTTSATGYTTGIWASTASDQDVYMRFYFRYATAPGTLTKIFNFRTATAERASIRMNTNGTLELWNASAQVGSDSPALASDTWYRIEIHYDSTKAAGSDILEACIDSENFAASDTESLATVGRYRFGILDTTTANVYFDDIALNNSTGKWPGPGRIIHLRPNGNGDNSAWTNDYTYVDELTPDDTTTLVSSNTTDQIDDHNIQDSSLAATDVVNLVQIGVRFNGSGASSNASFVMRAKASSNGTTEESSAITPDNTTWRTNGLTYNYGYPLTLYDLPGPSTQAWRDVNLDYAQIGYRLSSASTNAAQISTAWMLVDYTPTTELEGAADEEFADHFESGDFTAWDDTNDPDTDELNVTTGSKKFGKYGMAVTIDDQDNVYVGDGAIGSVTEGSARFYFNPNGVNLAISTAFEIFYGVDSSEYGLFAVQYGRGIPAATWVRVGCRDDGGGWSWSNNYIVSGNEWHNIEVGWKASSGAGNNDGSCELIVDNVSKEVVGGIDNDTHTWDKAAIGAVTGVDIGTSGTIYFDAFESNTSRTEIGPPAQAKLQYCNEASCSWTDVTDSEVISAGDMSVQRTRSAITLTSAQIYRTMVNSDGENHDVANAKVVIDQTAAGGITDVELIHQQMNSLGIDTDNTYTSKNYLNRFNPDLQGTEGGPSLRGGTFTYFFESTLKTSTPTTTIAYAQLYDITNSSIISSSEVTTTNDTYTRARSGDITSNMPQYPQSSAPNLDTQLKNSESTGDTTSASSSWLIVQASNLATSGVTAYADLYNIDDTTQVSGSEVSTTSSDWTLLTSGPITLTTDKKYAVRLRSSNNNVNIHLANAKIILDQSSLEYGLEETEISHQQINTVRTDSDTGYTEQNFLNEFDPDHFSGGTFHYYFESTMKTSGGTGLAKLKDRSTPDEIDNPTTSELQTTSGSYERQISSDLSGNTDWPSSAKNMDTIIKNSGSSTTSVSSSRLLIQGESIGSSVWPNWENENMCVSGKCLSFNGTDDFAMVVNAGSIDLDQQLASGFTFQTWVRVNSDGENNVGEIFDKGPSNYLRIANEGSDGLADLEASLDLDSNNATLTITDGITLNKWHHVAVTYTDDGDDEITIYIDGINKGSSINGDGVPDSDDNDFLIGGSGTANFHGFMDEFKIYKTERSAAEIATDYQQNAAAHGASAVLGAREYSSLSEGLVGYWKMDESSWNNNCSALTVTDSSGNNNHGKACPSSTGPDGDNNGKFGKGEQFDGSDDYVEISNTELPKKGPLTVSAWVKMASFSSYETIISRWSTSSNQAFELQTAAGSPGMFRFLGITPTGDAWSASYIYGQTGQWYHLVGVVDDDGARIFVNGVEYNGTDMDWDTGLASGVTWIGRRPNGDNPSNDTIDEIRIYNRALTPSEIEGLYHWGPGPVGYWNFDEGGGTTAYDSSGNGNTGTYGGGTPAYYPTQTTGKFGGGLSFDDTDDYIDASNDSSLDITNNQMTLEAWVNFTAYGGFISKGGYSEGYRIFVTGTNQINFQVGNASHTNVNSATNAITPNVWTHVAGVYDGSKLMIYINGIKDPNETSKTDNIITNSYHVWIGMGDYNCIGQGWCYPFGGKLDEVKIYNYARTQEQIIQDMNAGHPAPGSPIGSPVGYWKFDEGYGDTTNDSGTGGNNGTLVNTAEWSNSGKFDKAVYFDGDETGNDTHVRLPDNAYNGYFTGTISLWFKQDDSGDNWQNMFGVEGSAVGFNNTLEFAYEQSTDRVHMYMLGCDGTNLQAYYVLPGSQTSWHHAAWTISETGNAMYIDGAKVDLTYTSGNSSNTCFIDDIDEDTTTFYTIGCLNDNSISGQCYTGELYEGLLDEVKVYNFALTADQIKLDYNKGASATFGNVADQSDEGFGGNAPIAWWKFDENTDNTCDATYDLCDTTGNNIHGAKTNMEETDWVPGKIGSALDFDGTNEYVALSSQITLADNAAWTISYWYTHETTDTGGNYVMGDRDDFANSLLHVNSGVNYDMAVTFDDIGSIDFDFPEDERFTWHHITVVCDGSDSNNVDFYYDGVYQQTGSQTDSEIHIEDIGDATSAGFGEWNGKLDDIKIYDYARSPAQIAYDYNRGAPVGYWELDECEGTTIYDSSPHGNNGTITIGGSGDYTSAGTCDSGTGTEAWNAGTTGKFNSGLAFDGTDDYIEITDNSVLEPPNDMTVTAWVKFDQLANDKGESQHFVIKKNNAEPYSSYFIRQNYTGGEERFKFMWRNSSEAEFESVHDGGGLSTNTWYHVAGVREGNEVRLYVNGDNDGAEWNGYPGASDTLFDSDHPLRIGTDWSGGGRTDGIVDDVRLYNYALTEDQIKKVMNQGAAVRYGPSEGSP